VAPLVIRAPAAFFLTLPYPPYGVERCLVPDVRRGECPEGLRANAKECRNQLLSAGSIF
jgi:hypothetical protein